MAGRRNSWTGPTSPRRQDCSLYHPMRDKEEKDVTDPWRYVRERVASAVRSRRRTSSTAIAGEKIRWEFLEVLPVAWRVGAEKKDWGKRLYKRGFALDDYWAPWSSPTGRTIQHVRPEFDGPDVIASKVCSELGEGKGSEGKGKE